MERPPGGACSTVVGRSVSTLPQFWWLPQAKALEDTGATSLPRSRPKQMLDFPPIKLHKLERQETAKRASHELDGFGCHEVKMFHISDSHLVAQGPLEIRQDRWSIVHLEKLEKSQE